MRPRYLVLASAVEDHRATIWRALASGASPMLSIVMDRPELLVAIAGPPPVPLTGGGVIIGELHERGRTAAATMLDDATVATIRASRGAALIDRHWGGYVAVLAAQGNQPPDLIRAPFGDLPCFYVELPGAVVAASDLALLELAGWRRSGVDWPALVRHVAADAVRREETCLTGVRELPGGARLTLVSPAPPVARLWSPWKFADPAARIANRPDAIARVRDVACHCVAARTAGISRVVLKLSGGLDSSIVAAALRHAGREVLAMTLVTDDPAGDERDHARAVAHALDLALDERHRRVDGVDLSHSAAFRLPRPTARSFTQESQRHAENSARAIGGGAIVDGGGGDNVFCSLQSVRPVTDAMRSEVPPGTIMATAASLAELADASVAAVLWRAWLARWRGSSGYRWPLDLRFLSPQVLPFVAGALAHPWLEPPGAGALPGKAAHVALVTAAQSVAEAFDAQDALPTLSPLLSQPLVETCLRVPTWCWYERGHNRAIARAAFAGDLPASIAWRRSKGGPDSFIVELFEANRGVIRTMLLDGTLAKQGLLDCPSLERAIADIGPVRRHDFLRIMQLVDVEAWLAAQPGC